jgi:hypothetical protein
VVEPHNFMFNEGSELASGLIDQERLHQVLNKVKSIAVEEKGKIDYEKVADYSS